MSTDSSQALNAYLAMHELFERSAEQADKCLEALDAMEEGPERGQEAKTALSLIQAMVTLRKGMDEHRLASQTFTARRGAKKREPYNGA